MPQVRPVSAISFSDGFTCRWVFISRGVSRKERDFHNAPKHDFNRKTEKLIKMEVLELGIAHLERQKSWAAGLLGTLVPLARWAGCLTTACTLGWADLPHRAILCHWDLQCWSSPGVGERQRFCFLRPGDRSCEAEQGALSDASQI